VFLARYELNIYYLEEMRSLKGQHNIITMAENAS
jgi:hypothetical protein